MNKQFIGWIVGVFVLFPIFVFLYNKITIRKNDGEKGFSNYYKSIEVLRLNVPTIQGDYSDTLSVGFDHYRVGASAIGFKGLSGNILSVSFLDLKMKKIFKIAMYDVDKQKYYPLSDVLEGKEIMAWVNKEDLKNPNYGTKEKPIPVFNFKGVDEPIRYDSENEGSVNGYKNLEPTDQQFKHNVLTYLTYIMPKDEFQKRFEKK
ncbi:hypothetical protein [Pedobacter sp. MR22-3]|uniref:hypothetical protein n=1 Tax=Pedobacter sp. MR22-3 TaxID=2994552 RepID=UPI0022463192|nr:hypothetical protein [Pedobacter sp. MR22-3]MCX2583502.1 hypothetical protein [Pedobacter sp. MR22-3]